MIAYSAQSPLLSLHIPKCAGQSFRRVLKTFFPERVFFHYFQKRNAPPDRYPPAAGICIHGHFDWHAEYGVEDYYPDARQFITVLRDPLQAAISNYFYWKEKARERQLRLGRFKAGDECDYRNIDDFFRQRPRSNLLRFLPRALSPNNYREFIESHFVWVGLVERLQTDVDRLAAILGVPTVAVSHLNAAVYSEELSPSLRCDFMERNRFEFEIYAYMRSLSTAARRVE
jgi:hypothetical protein